MRRRWPHNLPTIKQLKTAAALGVLDQITEQMTREEVADLIDQTKRVGMTEEMSQIAEGGVQEKLAELRDSGFCVGTRVGLRRGVWGDLVVRSIDKTTGLVSYMYGRGNKQRNHSIYDVPIDRIEPPEVRPEDDPDGWYPANFIEIRRELGVQIQKGKFGKYFRDRLVARKSFFENTTYYFLLEPTLRQLVVQFRLFSLFPRRTDGDRREIK